MVGKHILLIEDNANLAIGLETCLEIYGYMVQCAANGQDALSSCHQNMPDLVVMDIVMHHMDGPAFLQHLRALPGGDTVPVVVISGMADQYSIDDLKELGIRKILAKPFDLDSFLETVREGLQSEEHPVS